MVFYKGKKIMKPKLAVRKKRVYRGRKRVYRFRRMRMLPLAGENRTKMVRLRYCEEVSLNPSSTSYQGYVFTANGCYDPNVTGVGHQPSGFDQMMEYYDHYRVVGSKITVKFVSTSINNVNPAYVAVQLKDTATVSAYINASEFLESRQTGTQYMITGILSGYKNIPPKITKVFSARKFFGPDFMDESYKGSASGNPIDGAYYHVMAFCVGNNDPGQLDLQVTIDYICLLTEPKEIVSS